MLLEQERNFDFGHGCSGNRMLLEHERYYGLGMNALIIECARTGTLFCFVNRMLLEHERNYGLGMDALVTACSWNRNGILNLGIDALATACSWNTNAIMAWA